MCELELQWVDVDSLDSHTATIPVHVNVVPGDQAAGRIPDATVRTEVAFQTAQRAKREAADALRAGDAEAASRLYGGAGEALRACASVAPAPMADELAEEAELLRDLSARASYDDPSRMAEFSEADRNLKERKRGRGRPTNGR